ncbi:InlB B-repeat-containing protein [bacterium]|nr:InlB B-repeat-containing protein [bacterium]
MEAEFIRTINKYTITFYDEDGERVLDTQTVNYGTNAIYGGITPSKEGTQQYTYAFTGWYTAKEGGTEDNLSNVVANRNVYARYSSTVNKYNITFVDEDGTVLKASTVYDYGTPAVDIVKPADPTKESSTQYTYTFA